MQVDAVFLTSGHAADSAEQQPSGETVAIEGLGLTAMDTLASLTQGRGGRYVRDGGFAGWRYLPSGREPKVFLYSRSGLPFHARPQWHSPNEAPLPRLFLGAEVIAGLRQQRPAGQLDFRRDVLPLIKDEMRAVFYQARVPPRYAPPQLRQSSVCCVKQRRGPRCLPESYATWFVEWIERDLALSRLGTARSPIRLALEVWRDYRDVLRLVAGRNGLSEASTLDFYGTWAGLSNRLVGGPQKERHEDLLALIKAGVVAVLPPMDEARQFDCVIPARVAHNGLSRPAQGLIGDLLEQGLIRAAHAWPADGIETDRTGRALGRDGSPQPRLWVLGPVVEGCTFYNHYIPTPDPTCHALIEARRAVESCLAMLAEPDSRYLTCSFKKVL